MLVITYQCTIRICAEGSLTGAAQSEEQGYITIFTFICRAVHAQYFMLMRQDEVEDTKDAFLHFAGICRTTDQDYFPCKVYNGKIALACAIGCRIGLEAGRLQYQPVVVL